MVNFSFVCPEKYGVRFSLADSTGARVNDAGTKSNLILRVVGSAD